MKTRTKISSATGLGSRLWTWINSKPKEEVMNTKVSVLTILLAVMAAIVLFAPGAAQAAGTVAGTTVTNNATLDYKVGGVSQTQLDTTASPATFTVDAKVVFSVTAASDGVTNTVTPAEATKTNWLTFTVTNTSNTPLDFDVAAAALGGDQFDQAIAEVVVEDGTTADYQDGEDNGTYIDELAIGASINVYVVADVIGAQSNGDLSSHRLTTTALYNAGTGVKGATVAADTGGDDNSGPNSMDWVRADTGNDGIETADDNFLVSTATLSITKTSTLLEDPINGGGGNQIAIPGARISYTITVANAAGGATATEVTIADTMPAEMTYTSAGITLINTGTGAGTWGLTNASDGAEHGDAAGELAGTTVTVSGITLQASDTAKVIFNATIQ